MDVNHLRTFVTVAREGSITRASELLFRSQPTISAHIKALEAGLGVKLFDRLPRGMTITESGTQLLPVAARLLERHQCFMEEAQRLRGCLTGELRIGTARCANRDVVRGLLTELYSRFSQLEVRLDRGPSLEVINGIRAGHLDAGFYAAPRDQILPDLSAIEVESFNVYLACSAAASERARGSGLAALRDIPCICPPENSCYGLIAETFFEQSGFRPSRFINVDDETVARALIADGLALGVIHASSPPTGRIAVLSEVRSAVRVVFGHLAEREDDPVVATVRTILHGEEPERVERRPRGLPRLVRRGTA